MGNVVVTEFVSIDGVFQDPGGTGEMERGAWSFKHDRGDEGDKIKLDELMDADAQLLGRVTYEGFAAAWPSMKDDAGFADRMNSMPKYVVSTTIKDPEWENTTVISNNVADEVRKLKDQYDGDILVAVPRLMIHPNVVGQGKHLFGEQSDLSEFRLKESKAVGPDGVFVLTY